MAKTGCRCRAGNRIQNTSSKHNTIREKSENTGRAKQKADRKTLEYEKKVCDRVKKALRGEWTNFRDLQQTVVDYVKIVVFKMKNDDAYRSEQRQVSNDLENFQALRKNLEAEKNYYPISMYGSEILRVNAMKKQAKMLNSFSKMLCHKKLLEVHKKWIRKHLNNADPDELLQTAKRNTRYTYGELRRKYDEDVQSEIDKRTKKPLGHLKTFPVNQSKFRATFFVDRKNEFKQVQKQISREEIIQKGLSTYLAAYNYTLEVIKNSEGDLKYIHDRHLSPDDIDKANYFSYFSYDKYY